MNRRWKDAFPPVDEGFERGMDRAFEAIRKENRKVKKKISAGLILAAALLLFSAAGIAATKLNLFSGMTRYANPILPLEGAEKLVVSSLGSAENEWATVAVEEAAYDGQGVMVLARIAPKDPEKYALFHDMLMDAPEDEYIIEKAPVEVPEGEQEARSDPMTCRVVNYPDRQALYVDGQPAPIPDSREAAQAAGLPVYMEDGEMFYADQWDFRVVGRRDGKAILGFGIDLTSANVGADDALDSLVDGLSMDAQAQSDGSVLVWLNAFAEAPLPDAIELKLTASAWFDDERYPLPEIPFTLRRGEQERVVSYIPDGDGTIGDHVRVRAVSVRFTPVRAYLTVDYDYEKQPDEPMGIWLHPYGADGSPITTGSGSADVPEAAEAQGFYRQQDEMQSFDEIPDVIVLEAKAIDGEPLGRCVCRLAGE